MIDDKIIFRMDKWARLLTVIILLLIVGGGGLLLYTSGGSYLPAWFAVIMLALLLLASISMPRFMLISPHSVEIHCVLELTKIPIQDIKYVKYIEPRQMRYCFPLWGIYGLGGYYGYYFNIREWKMIHLYASQWRNFVLIESVHGVMYIVSCEDSSAFIAAIERYRTHA